MQERMREIDPARPPVPERAGWQPDPWGDGERYWDGEIWTRSTREHGAGDAAQAAPVSDPVSAPVASPSPTVERPRHYELEAEDDHDERPFRSGLMRGMIWAFAVVAILAMLLTAVSIWPLLLRGVTGGPAEVVVPQQSAHSVHQSIAG